MTAKKRGWWVVGIGGTVALVGIGVAVFWSGSAKPAAKSSGRSSGASSEEAVDAEPEVDVASSYGFMSPVAAAGEGVAQSIQDWWSGD